MEQTLKQRLIGAIVLVSLAVIFIPIILEGPDDEWTPRSHSLPEKPQLDYRADMDLVLPPPVLVDDQEPKTAVTTQAAPSASEKPASEPASKPVRPEVKAEPEPAPVPARAAAPQKPPTRKPAPPAAAQKTLKGWFVQVGSFGQEMNAKGLQDRLVAGGFKTHLQKIEIGKKHAFRVLVGPSASRAEAEKLAASLKSGQQLKGMVVEYPG